MSYVNYNSKKVLKKVCFLGPVILQPFLGGKVWRRKISPQWGAFSSVLVESTGTVF